MQITQTGENRALSADGTHRQIQVRHDMPRPRWGSLDHLVLTRRYLRYGIWTRRDGLSRLPIPPTVDAAVTREKASVPVKTLETMPSEISLPLGDFIELWLLDARCRLPLALLASALCRNRRRRLRTTDWIGALAHDEDIPATGPSETLSQELRAATERLIRSACGPSGKELVTKALMEAKIHRANASADTDEAI